MKKIILPLIVLSGLISCSKIEHNNYCGKVIGYDNNDHHGYFVDTTKEHYVLKVLFSDSTIEDRVVPKSYKDTTYCECCK